MNIWLRLSATFHEHPKMLAVRKDAGRAADSAELGWYRVLMASKRYGKWTFASDEHLQYVAGLYFRYVPLYRKHHLLDGLTVHDGESYNAVRTPAERKEEQRERELSRTHVTTQRDMPRDQNVTLEERERVDTEREERDVMSSDLDCLDTYYELTLYRPWGVWSGDKLREAQNGYGDGKVTSALRAESDADHDRKTLLDRALARLARDAEKTKRERPSRLRVAAKDDPEERKRIINAARQLPTEEAS